jgi:hypothetical protein
VRRVRRIDEADALAAAELDLASPA